MRTTRSFISSLCFLFCISNLFTLSSAVVAGSLIVNPGNSQVFRTSVTYNFILTSDSWLSIPSGATIEVTFPSDYTLPASFTCTNGVSTPLTCTKSGQRIIIQDHPKFGTGNSDSDFRFAVLGITNPSKTGTTGAFTASIVSSSVALVTSRPATTIITPGAAFCEITPDSTVIGALNTVAFSVIPQNTIPASGGLTIQLPKWVTIGSTTYSMIPTTVIISCTFSAPTGISAGSCYVDRASSFDRIQVRSLSGSIAAGTNLTLRFQSLNNPPQNTPYTFSISTLDQNSATIDVCSPTLQVSTPNVITIIPSTFFFCTTNNNLRRINSYDTCALTFSTTNPVPKDAIISVQFPSEVGLDLLGTISETSPYQIDELTATRNPPLITINNGVPTEIEATMFRLYFYNMRQPSTTKPTSSFVITISYNGLAIDRLSSGATYTPSAGSLSSVSVSSSPTTAGSLAALTFTFRISNPVTTASELRMTFPSEITVSDNPSMGCSISGTSPTCSMTSNVLTVTNYASRDLVNGDTVTLIVNGITLPTSTKPTSVFVIRTREGGYDVDMNNTVTLTSTVASITTRTIAVQSNPIVGGQSSYRLTFTNVNPIPRFGKIQIQLPTDNSLAIIDETEISSDTSATIAGNPYTFTTSIVTSLVSPAIVFTNPTNAEIPSGTSIEVVIPNLRNPLSTASTTSFSIRTFTSDDFIIDETTTGLAITANTMSPADFNSVTPSLSPSTTGQTSTYLFAIVPSIAQASTNTITFTFPTSITFATTISCRIGLTTLSSVTCTRNDLTKEITMTFGISINALQEFSVSIAGLVNPTSATTYTGLAIRTRLSGGARVHQRTTGISIPITPSIFSTVTLARSSRNLGVAAIFTFNFIPINTYPSGAYMELKVPVPPLTIRTTPAFTCQGISGVSITDCALKSGDATSIILTVATFAPTASGITFTIDSIINQQTQEDSSSFELYVKDSNNLVIDQKTSDIIALAPCNPSCLTCLDSDRYACTSCSSTGFFPLHDVVNMKCVATCPTKTYQDGTQCKACHSQCQDCTGPNANQCTACNTSSQFPSLHNNECLGSCPNFFYADSITKRCQSCESPCSRCTSADTCLSCVDGTFLQNSSCVGTCNTGYYADTNSRTCERCATNCHTCNSATTCSSCSSTSSYPIFYNNDCLSSCPSGTYRKGNTCDACISPCTTCSLSGNNCLTCTAGLYPLNGQCEACRAPCASCIDSPLSCGSCLGGLFLQGTNCVQSCSDGYYTDYSTSSCRRCSTNCLICSSSSACQSCDASSSTPLLYEGSCVSTCPNNAPVIINRECTPSNTTIVYNPYDGIYLSGLPFPFIIFGGIFSALVGIGRMVSESTLILSNIIGFLSLLEFSSWIALFILLLESHPGEPVSNYPGMPIILIAIIASVALNVLFYLRVLRPELKAESFLNWKKEKKFHRRFALLIQTCSIISFKSFRLLYSRFFGLPITSVELHNPKAYQHSLHIYTGINFFLSVLLALISAIVTANKDGSDYEQLLRISIEVIILSLIIMILTIIDALRISEAEKKGNIAPDATTLTVLNAQALSMLEKSIIDKLNESMDTTRKTDLKRPKSRLGAYKRRNSLNLDSSYEYNEGNSSFANLNNTQIGHKTGHKNDDSFSDSVENGQHGKDHYNDGASRVQAIEEIENDDDDQPTLNMKNKTLGQLRDMLKDKGHQLQPDKILIENKDGSIIVLKDKTSFLDNNLNMINGSPSKSMISSIRGFDEEAGRTKISKFMNEDDEAISLTARGRKARGQNGNKENGGESLQNTIQKHGNEESEEELELHDSYGNIEAKYSRAKIGSSKNLDGKENTDLDTINSGIVKRNNLLEPIRIEQDGGENPGNSSRKNENMSPEKMRRGFDNSLDEAQNYTPSKTDIGKKTNRDNEFMRGSPGFVGKPPTGRTNKSPIGKQDSTNKAPRTKEDPNDIGVEYLSSDSQHTAEDLHDHFQDDTPSNYDILNQRFAEDVASPNRGNNSGNNSMKNSYGQWGITQSYRTGPRSQLPPVNEVNEPNKKSLSSSPNKQNNPYMHNFLDEEVRNPNLKYNNNSNKTEVVHFRNMNQENSARKAEMGKRAMTPQHNQTRRNPNPNATGSRLLSSRGSARSGQVGSIGSLNKTAKNFNRGSSVEEDRKSSRVLDRALDSRRNSEEKMKRLESIYSSKIKVPRLNKNNSKSIKQSLANSRGFIDDDNISDQDELELHDFGKFEEIVNKMKKQEESVNKLEGDSILKETM